ncbi:hypothetical protein GGR57DRAFT_504968 [Xylariaceae sp. FL1272]|nr:hypothetical protein GGR57DRAFT_504968 [Xylariaceae sp. FL1272]
MLSLVIFNAFLSLTSGKPMAERDTKVTVKICSEADLKGNCMSPTIITGSECVRYGGGQWDNNMRSCNGDSTPDLYGSGSSNVPGSLRNKATTVKRYVN